MKKNFATVMILISICSICIPGLYSDVAGQEKQSQRALKLTIAAGQPTTGIDYVYTAQHFFVPEVTKRLAAKSIKIEWNEAYGASLAKVSEVLESTESGLTDIGVMNFAFEPTKLYLMNVCFFVPFNTPDAVLATKVLRRIVDETPEMVRIFEEKYNQKFLGWGSIGNYQLITKFPVTQMSDLKGKKIAAAGPNLPFLKGTGAVPVQSTIIDAYTSLQTGVYQGWLIPPSTGAGFKLHEVCKYVAKIDMGCAVVMGLTANLNTWKKLPKEVQDVLLAVAKDYELEAAKTTMKSDESGMKTYSESGVKVSEFSSEEKAKWALSLENIPGAKAKEADSMGLPGTKVLKAYLKYLEEGGYKLPRKWPIE